MISSGFSCVGLLHHVVLGLQELDVQAGALGRIVDLHREQQVVHYS